MSLISIGRGKDNDIVLNYPQISRHHAQIERLSENTFLIEDKDSTGGTFVNGVRINRSIISLKDEVLLSDTALTLTDYISEAHHEEKTEELIKEVKVEGLKVPIGINREFYKLKFIWDFYQEAKSSIKRNQNIKTSIIRAALGAIPFVGSGLGLLAVSRITPEEKLQALEMEFELKYICPSCKTPLRKISWEFLKSHQRRCTNPKCGMQWVDDKWA
ncbi:hypothetical protein BH09BAC2_BH09BAC2_12560 [soil metagenome]